MNFRTLLFASALLGAGASAANAQIYVSSPTATGTVLGGIAGAIIGGHNHNNWAAGAAIGALTGGLIGSAAEQPRVVYTQPVVYSQPVVYTQPVV